jgi:hypothetical protein
MKTDTQLRHDVVEELNWEPSINATHIDVAAKEGVVTLTGYVSSLTEKWTAERVVKGVAGVKAVANDLEVRLPGASNGRTAILPAQRSTRSNGIPLCRTIASRSPCGRAG